MQTNRFFSFSLTILFFALTNSCFAQQNYKTGLGLRGGYPSGITIKHFLTHKTAVDGILSFGWGGIGITGLYQIHAPIKDAPGFSWYYGGGAHFATANDSEGNPFSSGKGDKLFLGIDGVFGAEYVFPDVPIAISLDLIPIISIIPDIYPWFNAGISVRYCIK